MQNELPTVTIAMPVYNGGRYLRLAVLSILQQRFQNWRLVVVDDGSSDGAIEQLREFKDSRMHIISDGTNKGLAARLNEVIDMTPSGFFARMDHDDIAHPARLSEQVSFLLTNLDIDLVGTAAIAISETGEVFGRLPFAQTHDQICAKPWLGFYLPHPSWMGRAEWFRRHRYAVHAPYRCEDQELLLRAYPVSRYHAIPKALLAYRVRQSAAFSKLVRTRLAWAGVQMKSFSARKEYINAGLATLACAGRIGSDACGSLAGGFRQGRLNLKAVERAEWLEIISGLSVVRDEEFGS